MKLKAIFIVMITLLAALNGAAQQGIVVYAGAESSHFVDSHPGSEYSWRVLTAFNPETVATPSDFSFTSSNNTNQVSIHWYTAGQYYLDVIETDAGGCTNRKVLPISVKSKMLSIGFASAQNKVCFDPDESDFDLELGIFTAGEYAPKGADFPLDVEFSINGRVYTVKVYYLEDILNIPKDWFTASPQGTKELEIKLLSATDVRGNSVVIADGGDVNSTLLSPQPKFVFDRADKEVKQDDFGSYSLALVNRGVQVESYQWSVDPPEASSTDLSAINTSNAEIRWDGPPGEYTLSVQASNVAGCPSELLQTSVKIIGKEAESFTLFAGPDTLIGSCEPYVFAATTPIADTLTYMWEPAQFLDDPTLPNPVFTPGTTTTYQLTVTTPQGKTYVDSVTVSVAEIVADAGPDLALTNGSSVVLDGSASVGHNLEFTWSTVNGSILGSANTAVIEVDHPGTYFLEVSDQFGCTATDSVLVSRLAFAPLAWDDYDTARFETETNIDVLSNDEDADNDIDPSSLSIVRQPMNGNLQINADHTLRYVPAKGFSGTDVFEYRICDLSQLCDNAMVYVLVTSEEFLIPQAFTPNGDNINDFFEIKGIENYPGNHLSIINRWGQKVYEARNYGIDTSPKFWDGRSNVGSGNNEVPTGTYYYVLDLGDGRKPVAGSVYIER